MALFKISPDSNLFIKNMSLTTPQIYANLAICMFFDRNIIDSNQEWSRFSLHKPQFGLLYQDLNF